MNFDLTEDQKLLVRTVAGFCKKESPVDRVRQIRSNERGWDAKVWKQMGELGWLGVMFPAAVGGLDGSFVDAGLIIEQFGMTLVPEPYLPSVVVAGSVLLHGGSERQQVEWLGPMIAGETSLALAYVEASSRFDVTNVETRAEKKGDGWVLRGRKRFVLNGQAADHLIVSARTSGQARDRDGISLFVVDAGMKGVSRTAVACMDSHKAAMLELDGVEVSGDRLIGQSGAAAPLLELAMDYGAAAACAEGSGIAQAVLAMTRQYLCEREQFGVKIGTFQALQHRLVDMFVETELVKSSAIMAMIKIAAEDENERKHAISAAKVQLSNGGMFVVRQGIQLHGGIGVTDEHDVPLYFKRMHVLTTLFGDLEFHLERFGALPNFSEHVERSAAY